MDTEVTHHDTPSAASGRPWLPLLLGVAGLVQGLRALVHHERSRRVWAGTVLSGIVACCWAALAEAISPA